MELALCIKHIHPQLSFGPDYTVLDDGNGDYIIWNTNTVSQPTQAELEQVWNELEAERLATQYQKDRLAEYPEIGEQLDLIYKDQLNGTSLWQDKITEIKNKYPKPE